MSLPQFEPRPLTWNEARAYAALLKTRLPEAFDIIPIDGGEDDAYAVHLSLKGEKVDNLKALDILTVFQMTGFLNFLDMQGRLAQKETPKKQS